MTDILLSSYEQTAFLRQAVFADEQKYPVDKLFDMYETTADFLAVREDGRIIGCGRFFRENDGIFHIDNIAFEKKSRGKGFGKKLVESLVEYCRDKGAERVTVNAESYAVEFYEKCGFAVFGCEYTDENLKKVPMVKSFEFDGCEWIEYSKSTDAVMFRKTFDCKDVESAVLFVTTPCFFEPYFNGKKLTEDKYIPAWSNYEKRDLSEAAYPNFDVMTHRIYYLKYDISDKIVSGKNALFFHVGNGWYSQKENIAEKMPIWGNIKLIFKVILTMKDGTKSEIFSDESVLCDESYVRRSNIYTNETIDGRLIDKNASSVDYDDSGWNRCIKSSFGPSLMTLQDFPGDRFAYSIVPKHIFTKGNKKLYDLQKESSGLWIIRFNPDAKIGDRVNITFADGIDENHNLVLKHTGGEERKQCDTYIFGGEDIEFSPVFTWRAGRYIEVEGNGELIRFDVVYSPVKVTAKLRTSDETLAWFFDAYCNTQNCNIHCMIPSDCPHRERLGYTGDGQLCSGAVMTIFNSEKMYRKWMDDIADSQDIYNGHVQHTAPFYGGGGGPGGWGGAMVIVPFHFYEKFGDISVLEKYYSRMMKYLDYMSSRCKNNIVVCESEKGWCLGDWCTPHNDIKIPFEFVNTYFYIKCMMMVKRVAEIIGKTSDVSALESRIANVKLAFTDSFFSSETGSFCSGVQGADAFAVDIGAGDERTIINLAEKYESLGEYDTGIFGTDIVTRVLFEKGYGRIAYSLMTGKGETSFYNMKKHGATGIWENWDGCASLFHPMFGAVSEYIFKYILGIRKCDDSQGYKKIMIAPADIPETGDIGGSIMTSYGKIEVDIKYVDGVRAVKCNVPEEIEICEPEDEI